MYQVFVAMGASKMFWMIPNFCSPKRNGLILKDKTNNITKPKCVRHKFYTTFLYSRSNASHRRSALKPVSNDQIVNTFRRKELLQLDVAYIAAKVVWMIRFAHRFGYSTYAKLQKDHDKTTFNCLFTFITNFLCLCHCKVQEVCRRLPFLSTSCRSFFKLNLNSHVKELK
jgi:hypothetical protein